MKLEERKYPIVMREGWPFAGPPLLAAALLAIAGWHVAAAIAAALALFCIWFFRNPRRAVPDEAGAVVSPGDGKVLRVEEVEDPRWIGGRAWKISVFLNIFNVHVNRTPIAGKVLTVEYVKGKFFNASFDKASEANERTEICIEDDRGRKVVFRQIAGLVARRILCYLRPGDAVARGDIMGLIRFGSRVEVVLSADARVSVAAGDHVKGGSTVMAWLP
ncbi:MAG: phosphatidylserine decarboxylase family protein [Deltaproteobacteria bacterium]|nr:phosphatidylserine decarboxylase family protein [Deltaproteobacteria bacterium]